MQEVAELTTLVPQAVQGGSPIEDLVRVVLGGPPPWRQAVKRLDYEWSAYVARLCIGDRPMSPRMIFFRCEGCHAIRTSRRMSVGPCKCGGARMSNAVGKVGPFKALYWLARGY